MAKKATNSKTLVTFLLDRTGSMGAVRDDTIGAFNAYIEGLKQGAIDFTLVQFDSISIDKVHVRKPVKDVEPLTQATYVPRGFTPLIDASYKTIKAVEESLEGDTKTKVVICIQTDGQENASSEHTWQELNALIKEKTALGWQFNFMGVGLDAYNQGAKMGIARGATVAYNPANPEANQAVFLANASNTVDYSAGTRRDTVYSSLQKQAAGDVFDAPVGGAALQHKPKTTVRLKPKMPTTPKPIVDKFSL